MLTTDPERDGVGTEDGGPEVSMSQGRDRFRVTFACGGFTKGHSTLLRVSTCERLDHRLASR